MLDPAMQAFADETRARPRPRRASTRRSAEIDNPSSCGAAVLARRIVQFWAAAGFAVRTEIIPAGGPHESPVCLS
jgi:hypothetical protein